MTRIPTAEEITTGWGERCPDYHPDCSCCQMWAMHDRIEALGKERDAMRRKAISNARERNAAEKKLAEARADALEEAALECVRHAKSEMPITMWKWHPWIKGNLERVTSLNRKMRAKAFIRAATAIRSLKSGGAE